MSNAHRYRAAWRSITFNANLDDTGSVDDPAHVNTQLTSFFKLESLDLSRVSAEDFRELRQFLEGADPNEAYEGILLASGHGHIIASSNADLADKTRLLRSQFGIANCRIAAATADPVGLLPFTFKDDSAGGTLSLQLFARPAIGRPVVIGRAKEGLVRPFMFQLASFDPRIYSQTQQQTNLATAGSVSVTNNGDAYTLPVFTVITSGPATVIIKIGGNAATSVTFTSLPAGTWTIDCRKSTIVRADGTNGMPYRTAGWISSLFLLPGSNTVDTTGSSAISSGTVKFRDAYS